LNVTEKSSSGGAQRVEEEGCVIVWVVWRIVCDGSDDSVEKNKVEGGDGGNSVGEGDCTVVVENGNASSENESDSSQDQNAVEFGGWSSRDGGNLLSSGLEGKNGVDVGLVTNVQSACDGGDTSSRDGG
jgi:hypothetical protein